MTFKLFPSGNKCLPTVCIGIGKTTFDNGWVDVKDKTRCKVAIYDSAVWKLQDLINPCLDLKRLKQIEAQQAPHRVLFKKARKLYPAVAVGGLFFLNEQEAGCYYADDTKSIHMLLGRPLSVLLHELGHAYADIYYPTHVGDEVLAWDTAKSLAVELEYKWTEADDVVMTESLASYGLTPE